MSGNSIIFKYFSLFFQYLENFSTTIGVDWLNYDYKNSDTNSFNVALKSNYENTAGFMLAKLKLFDKKLIISGGLRYDEYDLEFKQTDKNDDNDDNPVIVLILLLIKYSDLSDFNGDK